MTDLFKTAVLQLMTLECYDQYFVNFNFFHVYMVNHCKVLLRFFSGECMKSTLSKVLGIGIVIASMAVKIPQILKIVKNKSGEGVSFLGVSLELISITSFFLYSYVKKFPFSAWGDGPSVGLQTVAILALILYYKKETSQLVLFLCTYFGVVFLVVAGVIPLEWSVKALWYLQVLNLPIAAAGKGAQILSNYTRQSTGQLSVLTYWLLFLGTLARIFTSMQDTGDMAIIVTFATAAVLNGVVVFQCYYYGGAVEKTSKKKRARGKKTD